MYQVIIYKIIFAIFIFEYFLCTWSIYFFFLRGFFILIFRQFIRKFYRKFVLPSSYTPSESGTQVEATPVHQCESLASRSGAYVEQRHVHKCTRIQPHRNRSTLHIQQHTRCIWWTNETAVNRFSFRASQAKKKLRYILRYIYSFALRRERLQSRWKIPRR